jgi:hypothetical protein
MLGAPATGPAQPASCSLEGAVYAETILIAETRDYVKKVMSNAVYYAAVFEGRPQSVTIPRQSRGHLDCEPLKAADPGSLTRPRPKRRRLKAAS